MERNVGGTDRTARYIGGAVLAIVGIAGYAGWVQVAFGPFTQAVASLLLVLAGAVLLGTAQRQTCPVNGALGINTARSVAESAASSAREAADAERDRED